MELADRIEIERLIFSYARHVDLAQYEALGRMFAAGRGFYARTNRTHETGSTLLEAYLIKLSPWLARGRAARGSPAGSRAKCASGTGRSSATRAS